MLFTFIVTVCFGSGCAPRLLTCPRMAKVPEPLPPRQHPETVLFVTDRAQTSSQTMKFSGEMNLSEQRMTYGAKCEDPTPDGVAICAKPSWLKAELPTLQRKRELLDGIREAHSDDLLYVHGFNFSFDEATQIAVRLVQRTGVQAVPIAYSWPSLGRFSAYGVDYDRNDGTVLHVVAHSMGNRALLWALADLNLPQQRLGQLVMIAPDVDAEIFKDLVVRSGPFRRKTLYVSNRDVAIRAESRLRRSRRTCFDSEADNPRRLGHFDGIPSFRDRDLIADGGKNRFWYDHSRNQFQLASIGTIFYQSFHSLLIESQSAQFARHCFV